MSGPVSPADLDTSTQDAEVDAGVEITPSRETTVGSVPVRRALPHRARRTVGAWCFVDHFGPSDVNNPVDVAPHPHIGLQTVTWLIDGEMVHRDSLGSEQLIAPGRLNLMSAGQGVSHSEEAPPQRASSVHGLQLWVAQPDATRNGASAFEHHEDLPTVELTAATATVLIGENGGERSPARADTPLLGLDLALRSGTSTIDVRTDFEHALVVVDGAVEVDGHVVRPGALAYLAPGREQLVLSATDHTRALLIGGTPFEAPVFMWWNFVARSREEIDAAFRDWQGESDRYGHVASTLPRTPAPRPSWLTG
jgi:redox-sensitive bicupin YhaK (pirin superfamily)